MTSLSSPSWRQYFGYASGSLNGLVAIGLLILAGVSQHKAVEAAVGAVSCTANCAVAPVCATPGSPTSCAVSLAAVFLPQGPRATPVAILR